SLLTALGRVELLGGHAGEAVHAFRAALAVDASLRSARAGLIEAALASGDRALATETTREAAHRSPEEALEAAVALARGGAIDAGSALCARAAQLLGGPSGASRARLTLLEIVRVGLRAQDDRSQPAARQLLERIAKRPAT